VTAGGTSEITVGSGKTTNSGRTWEGAPSYVDRWGLVDEAVWKLGLLEETVPLQGRVPYLDGGETCCGSAGVLWLVMV
jgi:hypothetical protein